MGFHAIGIQFKYPEKNSWNFSILEIILENPQNSWKLLNFGRSGNAASFCQAYNDMYVLQTDWATSLIFDYWYASIVSLVCEHPYDDTVDLLENLDIFLKSLKKINK